MRVDSRLLRAQRRKKSHGRHAALCNGLRESVAVTPSPRLRTRDYSTTARKRLGEAAATARDALKMDSMPAFAKLTGASVRSLWALENGEPSVGQDTLTKFAGVVPGWTLDTVRQILENPGDPLPEITLSSQSQTGQIPELVDYQAVVDIAHGLPREIVVQIVRAGFHTLPVVHEKYGAKVYNEALLKLLKLAELTGETMDDLLKSDAS